MNYLFNSCTSLLCLPDISKWDTSNLEYIDRMLEDCISLSYLPDISKWNVVKIRSMIYLFYGCSSLVYLPDISKWNFSTYDYMYKLNIEFIGCISISY